MKPILRALLAAFLLGILSLGLLELRLRTVASPGSGNLPAAGLAGLRILALGDSITHGGLREASYPFLLKPLLEKELKGGEVQVWNLGITGAETADLEQKIDTWLEQYHPQVVITMIGAGDRNTTLPAWSSLLHHFRIARLLEVSWRSWQGSIRSAWNRLTQARPLPGDPLAEVANAYYLSGKDDVDYIRTLHDPLIATERLKVAERLHRRMLLKWPKHEHARLALGLVRAKMGQSEDAEQLYRSVIADHEAKPEEKGVLHWAYFCLAALLAEQEREKELEGLLSGLLERYPWNEMVYEHLAVLYRKQNRGSELEHLLEAGIEKAKNPDRLHMMLSRFFRETGHEKEAAAEEKIVHGIWERNLSGERTAPAYRALSASILASGAIHLAMQYPVLELSLLQEALGEPSRDFAYVSNENFRAALANRQFSYYFLDDFGGLYGHLTRPGAELMAENVAAVLLPLLRDRALAPHP